MEVAGILLEPIFEVLLDKLCSLAVSDYVRREGIHHQLKKLEKMLPDIRDVLADAEDKQMTNRRVKSWMEDLTDLAYDLDDLLDDVATEALRLELLIMPKISKASSSSSSTSCSSKVRKLLIPTCCTSFTTSTSTPPNAVKLDHNMMSKVEEITVKLQDIETRKSSLDLIKNVGGISSNRVRKRTESTSSVDKSQVYGRENDKEAIFQLLLKDEASVDKISVIPIVGMGGIGKTTLAQLVYDDERLEGRFDLKAWVCVSDDFDVLRVTKRILEAVTSKTHDFESLNMLQQKLKENLSGKRFFLVLDDIWNENYEEWDLLRCRFMVGASGSKIIVTTRHGTVASTMSLSPAYSLNELSKDECLSLFAHHALGQANFNAHPNFKGVGEQIVNKCKGLPLAAKTLGGLLRNKSRQREWENILNSKIWDLPEQKSGILPALILSYHHLPSHLKQCFAYCAIFPKDYEFDKDELVLLWMGVGLLQLSKEKKQMEDFGDECFEDLLSRSFFQQSGGSKSRLVMHDLLNDLALHVIGDICFRLDKLEGDEQFEIPKRVRHFSYIHQEFEVIQKFKALYKVQHLRTFLPILYGHHYGQGCMANKVLFDLFPKLQCLRVLSLSDYAITKLPDSTGGLKHLRYLNLSKTSISQLPESVSTLYNLQTLLLRSCKKFCMLSPNIGNLINLRHLDIADTDELREMSSEIGRLTNLQTLSKFIVGENNGPGVKELRNLRLLRGSISITELQNITDVQDANKANLRAKQDIEELELAWCSEFNDFQKKNLELDVLDKLQPHRELKKLTIKFYGGTKFSSWIGDPLFSKMVNLTLEGCKKCTSLPPLGQLVMLKELCIRGMDEVQNLGIEFYGDGLLLGLSFPSLERLIFEDMPAWEEWSCCIGVEEAARQFPCLRELTISGCPKLVKVSVLRLSCLQHLDLKECEEMVLKNMVDLTSLASLRVENIIGLSELGEVLVQSSLGALESLVIKKCNQLVTLWQNDGEVVKKKNLVRLKRLTVSGCPQLVSFGADELDDEEVACIINLQELEITNCVKLEKFSRRGVSSTLRKLQIVGCDALKSLPEGISGLENLDIVECSSLRSWPTDSTLPTALKWLHICDCMNLEYFSEEKEEEFNNITMSSLKELRIRNWSKIGMLLPLGVGGCVKNNNNNFASLRTLWIKNCNVVESLSFPERGGYLPNLRSLHIVSCVNLRTLATTTNQILLESLESLFIIDCESLESLLSIPERGGCFCFSTPSLRSLHIINCSNMRWFPFFDDQILQSLQLIYIRHCPCFETSFPQGNFHFPPSTSLRHLYISGVYPELVTFPFPPEEEEEEDDNDNDKYCLLPPTLTTLMIASLPNLESISSKGLQNLTSLQHLYLSNCPKFRSLPKEGLPSTLQSLQIINCPRLKQRCLEDGGDYWPNIAHIPHVATHRKDFAY